MIYLHDISGGVDVSRLCLIRLGSYGLTSQGVFVLAEDILSCVRIIDRYRAVYHIIFSYIAFLVFGGRPSDDMPYFVH